MIRHARLDRLERLKVGGVQAISVKGQRIARLGRIAWMVWTGLLITHLEDDHKVHDDGTSRRSTVEIHDELHRGR